MRTFAKRVLMLIASLCVAFTLTLSIQAEAKSKESKPLTATQYIKDENGKWVNDKPSTKYKYDKKGRLVKLIDPKETQTWTYNKRGYVTKHKLYQDGNWVETVTTKYRGNKIKSVTEKDDEETKKSIYYYKGGKLRTIKTYINGRLYFKEKYKYKGKKLIESVERRCKTNKIQERKKYKDNKLYKRILYYSYETYTYTYDKKGNLVEETSKKPDGIIYRIKYTYNKHWDCVKKEYSVDGKILDCSIYTYIYDKNNNILEQYEKYEDASRDEVYEEKIVYTY